MKINKKQIPSGVVILLSILLSGVAFGEEPTDSLARVADTDQPIDSVATYDLKEVVVEGQRDVITSEKMIFRPDKNARESSFSAASLLSRMAIPVLSVNPQGRVSMSDGAAVAFFIDYLPATESDLNMMRTADVKNVEILTNPSDPRFRGAQNVINFIMYKYEYGGYTKVNTKQILCDYAGSYELKSKFTKGRMTFDVAGSYKYSTAKHIGEDVTTSYDFPNNPLTTFSSTLDSRQKQHNGYASLRAVYARDNGLAISNTLYYSGNRTPVNNSRSVLTYTPAWYPDGYSANQADERNNNFSWDGYYYLPLSNQFSVTLLPSAAYANGDRNTIFTNDGHDIINLGKEKSWRTELDAILSRRIGSHVIGFDLYGYNQANSITYEGSVPSKTLGRDQFLKPQLRWDFGFRRFQGGAWLGALYTHTTFGNLSNSQWNPRIFIYGYYHISQKSSLNFTAQYTAGSQPLTARNPELVMQSLVSAVQGNPNLKDSPAIRINVNYTYLLSNQVSIGLYGAWENFSNYLAQYWEPLAGSVHPVMVKRLGNDGSFKHIRYGANLSLHLFDRSLVIQGLLEGMNEMCTSYGKKKLNAIKALVDATYYFKHFYVQAYWLTSQKYLISEGTVRTPWYYHVAIGYGYKNFNVILKAMNLFRKSWANKFFDYHTPNYSSQGTNYGGGRHQSFSLTLDYSFGYGKRIDRGNELDQGSTISSGLVN